MWSRLTKIAVSAALFGAPIAAWSAPASAVTIGCGSTVTGPASLSHDLHCHGDGITLLSGRLDLHHHTISGDGTGTGITVGDQADGYPAVSAAVANGTIAGFDTGITSPGADTLSLALTNVTVSESATMGVDGMFITSTSLDHVTLTHNQGTAIEVTFPNSVSIAHSAISHNGNGIVAFSDGHVTIVRTTITSNTNAIICSQGLVSLTRSSVSHNSSGVQLSLCEGSTLTDSTFVGNTNAASEETDGFTDIANPTLTVRGDTFESNQVGLHLTTNAMAVVVRDSVFRANRQGVVMDACDTEYGPCDVPISDEFVNNVFTRNKGNGLTWGFGTVRLSHNHFVNNGGWGFFAADGTTVVDAGNNDAHDNGLGGCQGLTCS